MLLLQVGFDALPAEARRYVCARLDFQLEATLGYADVRQLCSEHEQRASWLARTEGARAAAAKAAAERARAQVLAARSAGGGELR